MTYGQLGWIDAVCFAFGMVMEVPTGAISDLVGKKKTLILAHFLSAGGFMLIAAATQKHQILLGFLIAQAGWAFYSGAAEALAFDSLKEKKQEKHFDTVISASNMMGIFFMVFSSLLGIWLYNWNFRAPHFAVAITYGIGLILSFFLVEPKIDTEDFSFKNYFSQLAQGARQLFQPALRCFLPLIFAMLGVYYMFSYGFIKPAMAEHFDFFATEQAVIFAGLSLLSAVLVHFVPVMRTKLSDAQGLIILTTTLGIGFLLSGWLSGWSGLIALALIVGTGILATPWVSVVVNRELPSKYRATTLSTIAMVTKVPYILVAVIAGNLIQDGLIVQFNLAVGGLTLVVALIGGWLLKGSFFKKK